MSGITVSEAVMLKPEDIDRDNKKITVKGKKETTFRIVPVSTELIDKLNLYLECYHPSNFLFEGFQGKHYSERCIQKILKKYVQKAGIDKKTSVHTLRYSFANQLLENGSDIGTIQEILGHQCRRTTELYAQMILPGAK